MRPSFNKTDINKGISQYLDTKEWERKMGIEKDWLTPEKIPVKGTYFNHDIENMEHLDYAAGLPPFLRGPYLSLIHI